MGFGLPPALSNALKYTGDQIADIPGVNFPRAPTTSDRNYPLFTLWRNSSKQATPPDYEGDMWYLARFDATAQPPNAIWLKLATGSVPGGTLISLSDTANTKVFGDATGNVQLTAGSGITITSTPSSNLLTFTATSAGDVSKFEVDANTAPGVNPVLPDGTGQVTVQGATVAAHSVPLQTRSRALNTYNIEAQVATAVAPTPANTNSVGLSCFNNAQFTVDATSGMVSLAHAGVVLSESGDTGGAITPDGSGNIAHLGGGSATGIVTASTAHEIDYNVWRWVTPASNNWVPVVAGSMSAGTATYIKQHGVYSRVGNNLFFTFDLEWTGHTGTGNMQITGFPKDFEYANTNYPYSCFIENITVPAGALDIFFVGENATTIGVIYATIDNNVKSAVQMSAAGTATCYGFYFTDVA